MTDPGKSPRSSGDARDNNASSARRRERSNPPRRDRLSSSLDGRGGPTVRRGQDEEYGGENGAARGARLAAKNLAKTRSDRVTPKERKARSKAKAVDDVRETRADEAISVGMDASATMRRGELRRPDRCAIVYKGSGPGRYGEFQVVVTDTDGSRTSVARSPAFRAPRSGPLRRRGAAWVAYELLVSRLEACGWRSLDPNGPWHELEFLRFRGSVMRGRRALVTLVRDGGRARFVAEELDTYGTPTPLMLSEPFRARRLRAVRPSQEAKAALEQLVRRMESTGWTVAGAVGTQGYAISFWKPKEQRGGTAGPRDPRGTSR
jgi:hypothetical protein